MKKWIIPVLLCAVLLLCGCGETPEPAAEPAPSTEAAPEATPVPTPEPTPTAVPLRLSEVMSANRAALADEDGSFPDWVELFNGADEPFTADGCVLRCGKKQQSLDGLRLEAGEYRVVFCPELGISKKGETLELLGPDGAVKERLELPALEADQSFSAEGVTSWPSPGQPNGPEGYDAAQDARREQGLVIWAAASYDEDGDWVELRNLGRKPLALSDYALSDRDAERLLCPLTGSLGPGETLRLRCEELGLALNARSDRLLLSRADGTLCDYLSLHDIPLGGHIGRVEGEGGYFYFSAAGDRARRVSAMPEAAEPDGVFEDVEAVEVELRAAGEIRFTVDGSLPTAASEPYTGTIRLTETGVIRAVSIEDGALPSRALSLSYILNEGHSLPVTSLVCDPAGLFHKTRGIYKNPMLDTEIPGALLFYGEEPALRVDCGIKLHGATSRTAQDKKSFKLNFRDRYGGELEADLFQNGVTRFSSILLRADQESSRSTYLRDTLMHKLAAEAFPELSTQAQRYSVLYINGEYWGIYSLREAHSPEHFARHSGYESGEVVQWKKMWDKSCPFRESYAFMQSHSPKSDENYAAATEYLDVDSVIAWAVVQAYSGNFDFAPPNMRFYWSEQDRKLHYALVDLDLGMFDYYGYELLLGSEYDYCQVLHWLLGNRSFQRELLRQMKQAYDGPLKDEAVVARIDELAGELRPEIERDAQRWNESARDWEHMVDNLKAYFGLYGGRNAHTARSLRAYITDHADWNEFFGG